MAKKKAAQTAQDIIEELEASGGEYKPWHAIVMSQRALTAAIKSGRVQVDSDGGLFLVNLEEQ